MADKDNKFFRELIEHHVSGQLKVAQEHIAEEVLQYMQKPAGDTYDKFRQKFFDINRQLGKEQYLIPYLMSSHPGSTLNSAIELAEYLRDTNYQPEQVQDFYPTPGTLSTAMFYTGLDPFTLKPIYVPKSKREKAMQRALLQYKAPRNYDLVYDALVEAGREDLIGMHPRCLIKPREVRPYANRVANGKKKNNNNNNSSSRGKKGNDRNSKNDRGNSKSRNTKNTKPIKKKKR